MASQRALQDRRGVSYSTASRAALDAFETALDRAHSYFGDPFAPVDEALAHDPELVMGHCFKAGLMCMATEKGAEPALRDSLMAAERLWDKANARERGHIAAARAWADGDLTAAVEQWGAVALDHPRDSLAIQLAHLGDFYLGQSQMLRDRVARVLPHWNEDVEGYGYILGMHAFGLEETNLYGRAEDTGRRALALNPRDPWAVHAVAHVMEMEARLADGIDWLTSRRDDWAPDNMFAFHNWWHLALYHLDLEQYDRALELYDTAIRPKPSSVALEMLDAAALLWRLRLRGVDVGGRWAELADAYAPMAADAHYAFNDAHAMMAFTGAGRAAEAATLLAAMEARVAGGGTNAMMTRDVGLPLARAILAFDRGDHAGVVELLKPIRLVAHRFGGSHAQRDLVTLTLIEAAIRSGQGALARGLTAERLDLKPKSPFSWLLSARAADATGEVATAEAARRRARTLAA
jgi:tetratricopeptide (TPR) repeat protein